MDKLKPILAHKFWIGYGVAVVLPIIAWWLATSNLAAETKKRTDAILAANGKATVTPDSPNGIWIEKLRGVNETHDKLVDSSRESLWVTQQKLQKFPPQSATYMKGVGYREQSDGSNVQLIFQQEYDSELQRLRDIVRPFDAEDDEGVVYLPLSVLPNPPSYGTPTWGTQPLSWDELWDTVEDNWLIEDLLGSINEVNRDYDLITEAPIRGIVKLELHGGQPRKLAEEEEESSPGGAPAGDMGPGGAAGGMPPGAAMGMRMPGGPGPGGPGGDASAGGRGGFGRGRGAGQTGGQAFDSKPPVSFDPVEVFGSPQETAAATGENGGMPGGPAGGGAPGIGAPGLGAPGIGSGGPAMGGGGAMGGGSGKARRYVDDGDELPFRTRGFYIELVMNPDSLPILIAQLTTSNWPVEILRVHQQDLYEDDIPGLGGSQGGDGMPEGGGRRGSGGRSMPTGEGGRGMPAAGGTGEAAGGASMTSPVLALFGGGGQGGGGMPGMPGAGGGRTMPGAGASGGRFGRPRSNFGAGGRTGGGSAKAKAPMSEGEKKGRQTLAAAMNDKGLVHVAIAGLLTLYSPPPVKPESDPNNPAVAPSTAVPDPSVTGNPSSSTGQPVQPTGANPNGTETPAPALGTAPNKTAVSDPATPAVSSPDSANAKTSTDPSNVLPASKPTVKKTPEAATKTPTKQPPVPIPKSAG